MFKVLFVFHCFLWSSCSSFVYIGSINFVKNILISSTGFLPFTFGNFDFFGLFPSNLPKLVSAKHQTNFHVIKNITRVGNRKSIHQIITREELCIFSTWLPHWSFLSLTSRFNIFQMYETSKDKIINTLVEGICKVYGCLLVKLEIKSYFWMIDSLWKLRN